MSSLQHFEIQQNSLKNGPENFSKQLENSKSRLVIGAKKLNKNGLLKSNMIKKDPKKYKPVPKFSSLPLTIATTNKNCTQDLEDCTFQFFETWNE